MATIRQFVSESGQSSYVLGAYSVRLDVYRPTRRGRAEYDRVVYLTEFVIMAAGLRLLVEVEARCGRSWSWSCMCS